MKNIEFRVWDNKTKMMYEISEIIVGLSPACWINVDGNTRMIVHGESGYIMQYTGLEDKDGNKIYEGDVFQDEEDGSYDCVVWSDYWGGWATNKWFGSHELVKESSSLLVVGNIYEDELLDEIE